jgi:hypothetical protein
VTGATSPLVPRSYHALKYHPLVGVCVLLRVSTATEPRSSVKCPSSISGFGRHGSGSRKIEIGSEAGTDASFCARADPSSRSHFTG